MSTLDNLKKEAKRWLKALQGNDAEARARFNRAWPQGPGRPVLRDVQHALARERGFENWKALTAQRSAEPTSTAVEDEAAFLGFACWDDHVMGRAEHTRQERAAMRLLERRPGLARASLYTAVVCGERDEVTRILAADPEAARRRGGARDWPPLLYLCFARLPLAGVRDHVVAIARALLDHGADPNAFFMAEGDCPYTALVGVAGEGEQDAPRHPRAAELYRLLLDHGAGPYDLQVLYNTHFHGDVLWWLEPTHERAVALGRKADWDDPDWRMLDMGGYGCGARYLFRLAIERHDLRLAEWLLAHGANPNAAPARDPRLSKRSLYEDAVLGGQAGMAELLARYGAVRTEPVLDEHEAFTAACLRLDRDEARTRLERHPEFLTAPFALFEAARRDNAAAVALLLDLGVSPDVADRQQQRALHQAAHHNAVRAAAVLIERGAAVDPRERNWNATPLGFATFGQRREMIDLLSEHSRDVGSLAADGKVERLRAVLAAEPELARANHRGWTPLCRLPDDEAAAVAIVELFLAHGADPGIATPDGLTAADRARKRGLHGAAGRLAPARRPQQNESGIEKFEGLARDLLAAHDSGESGALERINRHYGRAVTWEQLRELVRDHAGTTSAVFGLEQARDLTARAAGFRDWAELAAAHSGTPGGTPPFAVDTRESRIRPRRALIGHEWEQIIEAMRDRRITALSAEGHMTDAVLERISMLDHVTRLDLGGSRQLTDAGLRHLSRMPQLQHLELHQCGITDAGLAVVRELPALRRLQLCHHGGITDAGAAHLAACAQLEHVDLMNTATGDGLIRALAGKERLRFLKTGNHVTAGGVALLHEIPAFRIWQGGEPHMELMSPDAGPTFLWLYLRAQHLNAGIARLPGLNGLYGLSLHGGVDAGPFVQQKGPVTPADLRPVAALERLGWLGCDGDLCDDRAMRVIASLAGLRMLMGQGAVASDEGWEALGRSRTLEYVWGRECPGLGSRGFRALAALPALRGLAVSCKGVDDAALALMPQSRTLREWMPMDVSDAGFRHVGRCAGLEALWCMYCRETGDAATGQIAGLTHLRTYYAGKTRITDRSLEILSAMPSLERLLFWQCAGLTDRGVALLAALPLLREVEFQGGMPGVTLEGTAVFPPRVRVQCWR